MGVRLTPQATAEANIALLRDTLEAFNIGDIETCMTRLAPDFVINLAELPEALYGREAWRQGVEVMKTGFPDITAHTEDILAAHDKVGRSAEVRLIPAEMAVGSASGSHRASCGTGGPGEAPGYRAVRRCDVRAIRDRLSGWSRDGRGSDSPRRGNLGSR